MKPTRKFIDWEATGNKLFRLRSDNARLRKYVCRAINRDTEKCGNQAGDCATCKERYVDKSISRSELAEVFGVSESVINNWESGRTEVGVEDLLFYCQIAEVPITEILVFYD